MSYEIKISRTIDEVDKSKWDKLADFCFLKTKILGFIEKLPLSKNGYYLEIYDKNILIGIAVFYAQSDCIYPTLEESHYGKYAKILRPGLSLNPALLCHFPYSPFYEMFKIDEKYNKVEIFNIIKDELKKLAIENKYKSYGFLGMIDLELEKEIKDLYCIFSGFRTRILIEKKTFEEHVQDIERSSHRAIIRKEMRLFRESEYSFEITNELGKNKNQILKLFHKNFEKYDMHKFDGELAREFVIELDKNYDELTFFLVKKGKKIIAALLVIEDELRLLSLRIGQIENDERGFLFFNLAIYEPLKLAIQKNKKSFELGTGGYKYKTRRSATLYETCSFIKSTNNFKNLYLQFVIHFLNIRNKIKHKNRLDKIKGE